MKKTFALFLLMALLIGTICTPVSAEDNNIKDGGFETTNGQGLPEGWTGGKASSEISSAEKHSGDYSLRMFGEDAVNVTYTVEGLIAGNEYTLSAWVKGSADSEPSFTVQFSYWDQEEKIQFLKNSVYKTGIGASRSSWEQKSVTFTSPEGAQRAQLMIRKLKPGEVFFDDIVFTGVLGDKKATKAPEPVPFPEMGKQGKAKPKKDTPIVADELLINGGFEQLDENGGVLSWNVSGGEYDKNLQVYTEDPHGGKNGVWLYNNKAMYLSQSITRIIPGETYKLTAYIKGQTAASPAMKVEWSGYDENGSYKNYDGVNKYYPVSGEWGEVALEVIAPENATRAVIMIRLLGEGSVYFDDVSFRGKLGEEVIPDPKPLADLPKPLSGNLLDNASFENVNDGEIDKWAPYKGTWKGNSYVQSSTEKAYDGQRSLKISTKESGYPWARIVITEGLVEGAKYRVTSWINSENIVGSGVAYKYEFYKGKEVAAGMGVKDIVGQYFGVTNGGWKQVNDTFTVPVGAETLALYLRLYGTGTVYFDAVECYQISEVQTLKITSDHVFYYNDMRGSGTTSVIPSDFYDGFEGSVKFVLKDGETVLLQEELETVGGNAHFRYPLSLLTLKKHEYKIEASVYTKGGELYRQFTRYIYKYDRPNNLAADGTYTKQGKVIENPTFMYHVWSPAKDYPVLSKAGIRIVQANISQATLDTAAENGIMVIAVLYAGMQPAGHPNNAARTKELVTQFKDHPALFAWAVMDEPNYNSSDPYDLLRESYIIIRGIDDDNPVYIVEDPGSKVEETSKYCDIAAIDPYIGKNVDTKETRVAERTGAMVAATGYQKPVYSLLQTFDWLGYWPSVNDIRHQQYQAFMVGAEAVGYYEWSLTGTGKLLSETDLWEGLCEFIDVEMNDAKAHFSDGKYPVLNEYKGEDVWYHSYVKDGEVYVIALNMKKEDKSVSIPLTSFDGSVKLANFTVSVIAGSDTKPENGNGQLNVTLAPSQAVLYKVTPTENADFSTLSESKFIDLYDYSWARVQITKLEGLGIVNSKTAISYGPGEKITRGDFAMFLVRTLGLTSAVGDNFDDVDPDAEYAQAVAIGKASGILNGVGDNKFNPEAFISRQDLMTIIARGMNLNDTADLSAFSDAGIISGYALPHVQAMIASGLIKGNADGTVNPLGNTTRAEAAVIMYRILNK